MSATKKESIELSDWSLWSNHVLIELKRLNESITDLRKDLGQVTVEVVQLKVKSSLWGAVAGAITVLMIFGVGWVQKGVESKRESQPTPIYYNVPIHPNAIMTPQTAPANQVPQTGAKTP